MSFVSPRNAATLACLSQGRELNRQQFEDAAELRFRGLGLSIKSARFFAVECVSEFLAGEGIAFGAPGYDWTAKGARDLAEAEFKHWECNQ